jgi:hypothetical protein
MVTRGTRFGVYEFGVPRAAGGTGESPCVAAGPIAMLLASVAGDTERGGPGR